MSTVTATAPGTFDQETHHKKNTWAKVLPIIGIVLIVIYCLAPFYWMLVSSLRPDSEIFDNTWWPAHPSMENYQAVFQPSNNFLRGLLNSPHCLRRSDGHCSAHRHLRVLRARAPRFPRQGRIPHSHHRDVDVPAGGHHRATAEEFLGMALD